MFAVSVEGSFSDWRLKARSLLAEKILPEDIEWVTDETSFSFGEPWIPNDTKVNFTISPIFLEKAQVVSAFRDPKIWTLLYRMAYRLLYENKKLLEIEVDSDVIDFNNRYRLVNRDIHKMKAFVRFKEINEDSKKVYVAWHRPDHKIVRLAAPFFKDRFNGMNWIIMTEDETASWDGEELIYSEGVSESNVPNDDAAEDLWKTYYRSIFNPARIKISAMKKELPVRHWKTLPETELITSLIDEAPERLKEFYDSQRSVSVKADETFTLNELEVALKKCQACDICPMATAPVMGEGPMDSKIMFIGEQPGNEEDLAGKPFIGPAGELLNQALREIGFNRQDIYVTNAVKGFKHSYQQNMRWHRSANGSEISQCKPWLKQEIKIVKPEIIVCLGRTAAQSVLGKVIKLEEVRGKFFKSALAEKTIILPHPASILRADPSLKDELFQRFKEELTQVAQTYQKLKEA